MTKKKKTKTYTVKCSEPSYRLIPELQRLLRDELPFGNFNDTFNREQAISQAILFTVLNLKEAQEGKMFCRRLYRDSTMSKLASEYYKTNRWEDI